VSEYLTRRFGASLTASILPGFIIKGQFEGATLLRILYEAIAKYQAREEFRR
jgi:hypothetical protein